MTDALFVSELSVARGERLVVRDVSMNIPAGTITALIGPNGGGKSTVVSAIGGIIRPAEGSVSLGRDVELTRLSPHAVRAAGVAVVPEGHRVFVDLTVAESLGVAAYRQSRVEAKRAIGNVLEVFPELRDKMSRHAGSLSGGEQQMLAIAQALVSGPRFLVVDELSFGLAPIVVGRLVEAIRRVASGGAGVLLIEQFTTVALGISSTAYVMEGGQLHLHLPSAELRGKPELLHSAYLSTQTDASPTSRPSGPAGRHKAQSSASETQGDRHGAL